MKTSIIINNHNRSEHEVHAAYAKNQKHAELSPDKRKELALRYLPIVKHELARLAMRVPSHLDMDDLHGVAVAGMIRALERWSEDTEPTFGAYLRRRVRGSLLDELRRMDVFTRSARKKAKEYDAMLVKLEQRLQRPVTEEDICKELSLSSAEFSALMEELRPVSFLSIDAPLSSDENSESLGEILDDPSESNARDSAEAHDLVRQIHERMHTLPKAQQRVLHLYYFKDLRLAEIASVFGVSESRICQLHTQGIRSLQLGLQQD